MTQNEFYQAPCAFTMQELNDLIGEYNKEYQAIISMYITGYSVVQIAAHCNRKGEEVTFAIENFLSHCRTAVEV